MNGSSNTPPGKALASALREAIRRREDMMVRLTRDLVRCDSQTPPSDTRRAAEVVCAELARIPGVEVETHESEMPIVNVVATLRGTRSGKRLVLSGHLDTYPIGDPAAWTTDPLGGEIREGRLYGRGSCDMKGGVAALVAVVSAFAECAPDFTGEIVLALAGDEERMGELGTQWLLDHVPGVRGDAAIVADVGSPAIIRIGEKGMIWLDLEAQGAAAHGAHVHRGRNAIERLMVALVALRGLEEMRPAPPSEVTDTIAAAKTLSESLGGAGEADVLQRITVNIGTILGGTSANLVPDSARAGLDIRIPMGVTVAEVEDRARALLCGIDGVRMTSTRRYEPTWTSPADPIATAAAEAAAEVIGQAVAMNMRIGGSDSRLLRRAGIPTVVAGLTPYNLGADDEYFELKELVPLAEIHALTAARYFGLW